jgi:hypothetical protein
MNEKETIQLPNILNMDKYVYLCPHSIPEPLCDEIISLFENDKERQYKGVTMGGTNPTIKDTTDMIIPKNDSKWGKIETFLYKELFENLQKYIQNLHESPYEYDNNNQKRFHHFDKINIHIDNFMCQKYNKNSGKYIYHNDFMNDIPNKRHRVITYLWYLNDVVEGGETEFLGRYHVRPKKGQLLLFPASWCFPHRGKMPISDDKYIITGWFYRPGS